MRHKQPSDLVNGERHHSREGRGAPDPPINQTPARNNPKRSTHTSPRWPSRDPCPISTSKTRQEKAAETSATRREITRKSSRQHSARKVLVSKVASKQRRTCRRRFCTPSAPPAKTQSSASVFSPVCVPDIYTRAGATCFLPTWGQDICTSLLITPTERPR